MCMCLIISDRNHNSIESVLVETYSLMEGIGGDIVFYADILAGEADDFSNARFPCYEI